MPYAVMGNKVTVI